MSSYLSSVIKQFEYYKMLGEKSFAQLSDDSLFLQFGQDNNSIAMIVKHLSANMLSRFTALMTTDGEKSWRNRDAEFEAWTPTRAEFLKVWNDGWQCLFDTLASLKQQDLETIIYIRNEGHTVTEAINRQLSHYPYHIGQIVYIAKLISQDKWESLSIPKNKSVSYNQQKFEADPTVRHFTDEWLGKQKDRVNKE
ncbi:MAG TPA: DUF1572 family protein [Dyadobacter sp.]|jgi:hypothetical protein|nr:DUF1572 family protein [Dyadobacter sp.]